MIRSEVIFVCLSVGNMFVYLFWILILKRLQILVKIILSFIFSNVDMLVYNIFKILELVVLQKLFKFIFVSVESFVFFLFYFLLIQMFLLVVIIEVVKFIFWNIDFFVVSDCLLLVDLLYMDKLLDIIEEIVVKQQCKLVNFLSFVKVCEEESFGVLNFEDDCDGFMEIEGMCCEDIWNFEY